MTVSLSEKHSDAIAAVIDEVVRPGAAQTDKLGEFPRASIDALAGAGLLGLVSSAEVGGGGAGLADATVVVEQLAGVRSPGCGPRSSAGTTRWQGLPGSTRTCSTPSSSWPPA